MCMALIFECADRQWPTAQQFLEQIKPKIEHLLTSWDLEQAYTLNIFLKPWLLLRGRANVIAKLIKKKWRIHGHVCDMPARPLWIINATCYETGKNFRFTHIRMGDYLTNYVVKPKFPLAEAVAASAAVPGLIGPLSVKTAAFKWLRYEENDWAKIGEPRIPVEPISPRVQLWDGGVYDNLGVEPLYKPGGGFREEVETLIVSDASRPLGIERRRFKFGFPPYIAPIRLVDAATDQVRSLRTRTLHEQFNKHAECGAYLRMGDTVEKIYGYMKAPLPTIPPVGGWLDNNMIQVAASMPTTLRRLSKNEYKGLVAHGFEVTNATMNSRFDTQLLSLAE